MTGYTVVGLDLSLTSTGIAVIYDDDSVALRTAGSDTAVTTHGRWQRLARLTHRIVQVIDDLTGVYRPALVVIEGPSYNSKGGHQHDRSGLWWLVVDRLHSAGLPVVEVSPPSRMKYATGKGQIKKDAVLAAAIRRYPQANIGGNDTADALILAAMGRRWLGHPIETSLPQTHLAAMNGVHWPVAV